MTGSANAGDDPVPLERVRVDIELEIPSDVRYITRVVELVTGQCTQLRFPPHHCSLNVPVALTEALSNAILRGNREVLGSHVRVRAHVEPESLVMEVVDQGAGFDLEACTIDPTTPENMDREDGRGLYLMRKLMDRVERFDDDGNVVRLILKRP
jgi:serine/threonine-protein kinase RsbW